jgi:putative endonuclease
VKRRTVPALRRMSKGRMGEDLARRYLESVGFEIVKANYHFGHGEIDIIARDGEYLVFCEVKARGNDEFGPPEYALTPRKQQQIRRIASGYLYEYDIRDQACRFDVIAIRFQKGEPEINHLRNAF